MEGTTLQRDVDLGSRSHADGLGNRTQALLRDQLDPGGRDLDCVRIISRGADRGLVRTVRAPARLVFCDISFR